MIYIIGFMGAGKSTIGKRLAAQKKVAFFDTLGFLKRNLKKDSPM